MPWTSCYQLATSKLRIPLKIAENIIEGSLPIDQSSADLGVTMEAGFAIGPIVHFRKACGFASEMAHGLIPSRQHLNDAQTPSLHSFDLVLTVSLSAS